MIEYVASVEELAEHIGPVYLSECVTGWNLRDEEGPLPFDVEAVEHLPYWEALPIVEACDNLYAQRILDPLVARIALLSPTGPTASGSTSPTRSKSVRVQARSKPSSRNGSATASDELRRDDARRATHPRGAVGHQIRAQARRVISQSGQRRWSE